MTDEAKGPHVRGRWETLRVVPGVLAVLGVLRDARFGAAVASSALAVALLVGRYTATGEWVFLWMVWNLFLAWLPWLFALPMSERADDARAPLSCNARLNANMSAFRSDASDALLGDDASFASRNAPERANAASSDLGSVRASASGIDCHNRAAASSTLRGSDRVPPLP